jgi:hypothetical protein
MLWESGEDLREESELVEIFVSVVQVVGRCDLVERRGIKYTTTLCVYKVRRK